MKKTASMKKGFALNKIHHLMIENTDKELVIYALRSIAEMCNTDPKERQVLRKYISQLEESEGRVVET